MIRLTVILKIYEEDQVLIKYYLTKYVTLLKFQYMMNTKGGLASIVYKISAATGVNESATFANKSAFFTRGN